MSVRSDLTTCRSSRKKHAGSTLLLPESSKDDRRTDQVYLIALAAGDENGTLTPRVSGVIGMRMISSTKHVVNMRNSADSCPALSIAQSSCIGTGGAC